MTEIIAANELRMLAGDEQTLATDVVRTLNPALRLLALLLAPRRDAAPAKRKRHQETSCREVRENVDGLGSSTQI